MTAIQAYLIGVASGVVFTGIIAWIIGYFLKRQTDLMIQIEMDSAKKKIDQEVKESETAPINSVVDALNKSLSDPKRKG